MRAQRVEDLPDRGPRFRIDGRSTSGGRDRGLPCGDDPLSFYQQPAAPDQPVLPRSVDTSHRPVVRAAPRPHPVARGEEAPAARGEARDGARMPAPCAGRLRPDDPAGADGGIGRGRVRADRLDDGLRRDVEQRERLVVDQFLLRLSRLDQRQCQPRCFARHPHLLISSSSRASIPPACPVAGWPQCPVPTRPPPDPARAGSPSRRACRSLRAG